jgi:DNA topoisomerase IA
MKKASYVVSAVEKGAPPQPPAALHQEHHAARRGATPAFFSQEDHDAAQRLEGVDVGKDERVGLITYMRTDSVRVSM